MKNHAFLVWLLLGGFSAPACADWVEIAQFDDGMRVYVDKDSVRREGENAELRHLVRWGEPQEDPGQAAYRSTIVLTRYDCVGKREKYLSSLSYAGPMGDGIKVAADGHEVEGWYSISGDSMEEKLWETACRPATRGKRQ